MFGLKRNAIWNECTVKHVKVEFKIFQQLQGNYHCKNFLICCLKEKDLYTYIRDLIFCKEVVTFFICICKGRGIKKIKQRKTKATKINASQNDWEKLLAWLECV